VRLLHAFDWPEFSVFTQVMIRQRHVIEHGVTTTTYTLLMNSAQTIWEAHTAGQNSITHWTEMAINHPLLPSSMTV
jgi:hypothetical protein